MQPLCAELGANLASVQDADESGIAGVVVMLYDVNNTLVATTTTDANGNYLFSTPSSFVDFLIKNSFKYKGS